MSRRKKMTPAEKASARWEKEPPSSPGSDSPLKEDEPANGDHFVISLALIAIVAIAAIAFTTMQGGVPF